MSGFLVRLIATGVTFIVAARLVPQIDFPATKLADPGKDILAIGLVALVFGLVNGLIKPAAKMLSLPIRMMTLGLFSIVINAALLLLVAWAAHQAGVAFAVGGFPPHFTFDTVIGAVIGSVVIGLVGAVVGIVVRD
jgi:putative membrane protein